MSNCGACKNLVGGRRHQTHRRKTHRRKTHRRKMYRGGNPINRLIKIANDAVMELSKSIGGHQNGGRRGTRRKTHKRKHHRYPKKGQRSRTHKGRLDFTTKKSSKVFHRRGHYQRRSSKGVKRRPFHTRRRR